MMHCETKACANVGMHPLDQLRDSHYYDGDLYIGQLMAEGAPI